ncbi:hypothetical protein JVU11DRAFT_7320 [Chiua virens]|nr:hypothetical protein JVU11DRAFT_7320 [Chiua virens]
MTCHTTQATKPRSSSLDIITYRYKDQLVYVPVSANYIQAISHARDAFPQLKRHRETSLSLSLTAPSVTRDHREQKPVGISAAAWPKLITHMSRYQVIDVHVAHDGGQPQTQTMLRIPDITITYADAEDARCTDADSEVLSVPPPPAYPASGQDVDVSMDDEKATYRREESAASIPTLRRTSSSASLQPKRSWFFQKLHGQFM